MEEVKSWQHDAERLVALLYLLERALPEHTKALHDHAAVIEEHEKLVSSYECGTDPHCIPSCPSFKSELEQIQFHQHLSTLHEQVKQQHLQLKQMYNEEMEKFRTLAKKMLDEC